MGDLDIQQHQKAFKSIFIFSSVCQSYKQVKTSPTSRWHWSYHFAPVHIFGFFTLIEFTLTASGLEWYQCRPLSGCRNIWIVPEMHFGSFCLFIWHRFLSTLPPVQCYCSRCPKATQAAHLPQLPKSLSSHFLFCIYQANCSETSGRLCEFIL